VAEALGDNLEVDGLKRQRRVRVLHM
jgi:hypothetical protein